MTVLTIRMPDETRDRFRVAAAQQGCSMQAWALAMLELAATSALSGLPAAAVLDGNGLEVSPDAVVTPSSLPVDPPEPALPAGVVKGAELCRHGHVDCRSCQTGRYAWSG